MVVLTGRTEMRENTVGLGKVPVFVATGLQSADGIQESVTVEIRGRFVCLLAHWMTGKVDRILNSWPEWVNKSYPPVPGIVVDGKVYRLEWSRLMDASRNAAEGHDQEYRMYREWCGRTVIVTGTLEGETIWVRSLKADGDYIKKTVTLRIQGKLEANARLGYPGSHCPIIAINGGTYVLDFGSKELADQAQKLNGKNVVVTGTLSEVRRFPSMCVAEPLELPVLRVTALAPQAIPYPFNLPTR
jgi:hypothetical protein